MSEQTSKLEKALDIIINGKLRANADDTLLEKFCEFIAKPDLTVHQTNSILIAIQLSLQSSLNKYQTKQDLIDDNLVEKLRVCGAIVSNSCQQLHNNEWSNCIDILMKFSDFIGNESNISIQYAYFKCINQISVHSNATKLLLNAQLNAPFNSFVDLLAHVLNGGAIKSQFVEREVKLVFYHLLSESLVTSEQCFCVISFKQLFHDMMNPLSLTSLDIIRDAFTHLTIHNQFIEVYDIQNNLVNSIKYYINDYNEKVFYLCETIGICVKSNIIADEIIEILVERKQLKGLIGFLTYFIKNDSNYVNMWLNYAIYPLIMSTELENQFNISSNEKQLIINLFNKNISDYCVKQLFKVDYKCFNQNPKHFQLLFNSLNAYINLNQNNRKLVVNSLSAFEHISINIPIMCELINCLFNIYARLIPLLSHNLNCIALKGLRNMINRDLPQDFFKNDSFAKIIDQFNNILSNCAIDNNNWEIVDSVLEVLYSICSRDVLIFTTECNVLIAPLIWIWDTQREEMCSTLRSTLIQILLVINFTVSPTNLSNLNAEHNCSFQLLLASLIDDELIVRQNVIKTLNDKRSLLMENQNKQYIELIIATLCRAVTIELDDYIQCEVLRLIRYILIKINEKYTPYEMITIISKLGFFHTLFYLLNQTLIFITIRKCAFELFCYLRDHIITNSESDEVIKKLLAEEIAAFSSNSSNDVNMYSLNSIDSVDTNAIINFWHKCHTFTINEYSETEHSPNLSVLDDILSVSLIESDILIDCY